MLIARVTRETIQNCTENLPQFSPCSNRPWVVRTEDVQLSDYLLIAGRVDHLHWEVCYPCSIPETTLASPRNMLLPGLIALNLPHLQKPGPWQPAISVIRRRKIMASSSVKLPATCLFLWKCYCIVSRRFSYTKCVVSVVRTPNCRKDPYLFSLSPNVFCAIVHSAVQCGNM